MIDSTRLSARSLRSANAARSVARERTLRFKAWFSAASARLNSMSSSTRTLSGANSLEPASSKRRPAPSPLQASVPRTDPFVKLC